MLFYPMDFGDVNIDGLQDTGALSWLTRLDKSYKTRHTRHGSAIPEADLKTIRFLALQIVVEVPAPYF